ncbi:MAG: hypothetical protein R2862_05340 [Thermoanaerobaculia bacterium]
MDTELFALPESESVQTAISAIQEKRDLEMIFYLYVVDRDKHLVGVSIAAPAALLQTGTDAVVRSCSAR